MPIAAELIGQRFGNLTVISRTTGAHKWHVSWLCQCECGAVAVVITKLLRNGGVKSCGCLRHRHAANRTHGMSGTAEFNVWLDARRRCHKPSDRAYRFYGARGIQMSEDWRGDFGAFYRDMGPRPKGATLDRIDNDGPYSAENCRWATWVQQANNKRSTRHLEFRGESKPLAEWAREIGVRSKTLRARIDAYKWSVERALTTPVTGR